MMSRENQKTVFFDCLNEYVENSLVQYNISSNYTPTADKDLTVDYLIPAKKPIYIFAVNDDVKAAKTVISCLAFHKRQISFRSMVVHEDFNSLGGYYRNQITNAVDKQFPTLDDFQSDCVEVIDRELIA